MATTSWRVARDATASTGRRPRHAVRRTDGDLLVGQAGRDRLFGEDGDDQAYGGEDADLVEGGAGNDRLFGEGGDDVIGGQSGNDFIEGDRVQTPSSATTVMIYSAVRRQRQPLRRGGSGRTLRRAGTTCW
jgi:Ca2+-binding RTX toxin-like protein